MSIKWIKFVFGVGLLFIVFDVDAGYIRHRSPTYGMKLPKTGLRGKTITLPGGVKYKLVWQRTEDGQGFWIGKYEVTFAQWYDVMGSSPSSIRAANRAVDYVSWEDCQKFCHKAGKGLRLPTEWELREAQEKAASWRDASTCVVCHLHDNRWEWCVEGVYGDRGNHSKSYRGEGLGFRICCPPEPLDEFPLVDVVVIGGFLLSFAIIWVPLVAGRKKALSSSNQIATSSNQIATSSRPRTLSDKGVVVLNVLMAILWVVSQEWVCLMVQGALFLILIIVCDNKKRKA